MIFGWQGRPKYRIIWYWRPRIIIQRGWVHVCWLGQCCEWMTDKFNRERQ